MGAQPWSSEEPFTYQELVAAGVGRASLTAALARGEVRRLVRGVYVAAHVPESTRLRVRAVCLVTSPGHVVIDRTAAWLHGVDILGAHGAAEVPPIEVCALRWHSATSRAGTRGRTRDLKPTDVLKLEGLSVTTPLRTALDLGCVRRRRDALAALDQFRRLFGITEDQLLRGTARYVRRRGVIQLRQLIPLSDPAAESVRESWTRLAIIEAGLPSPTLQYEVEAPGAGWFRLDHAYPHERVAVEYDGHDFHHTPEQVERDRLRRAWLEENGWTILVVRTGDFTGARLEGWLDELRRLLRPSYSNLRW